MIRLLAFRIDRPTVYDDYTFHAFMILPKLLESKLWMCKGLTVPCGERQLYILHAAVLSDGYTRITMRMRR
jgi:hypothetical protein